MVVRKRGGAGLMRDQEGADLPSLAVISLIILILVIPILIILIIPILIILIILILVILTLIKREWHSFHWLSFQPCLCWQG